MVIAGQPEKALAELIRFSRERPLTARMATALTALGLVTQKTAPVRQLLTQGVDEAEAKERVGVLRALARLHRRTAAPEAAIETLSVLLAEAPEDRRSRFVFNHLLEQAERWEELDLSYEKEARLLLRRRYFRSASRVVLRRARMWSEFLHDPARAALRYAEAAHFAEQGQDPHSAFLLRLLWVRALFEAQSPRRTIEAAVQTTHQLAKRVGREARLVYLVRELGLTVADIGGVIDEASSTLVEDDEGVAPSVAEALLVASAASVGASKSTLTRLEAHYVRRRAFRALARFYREAAATRGPAERSVWLEKLAVVLETELNDAAAAKVVWSEIRQRAGQAHKTAEANAKLVAALQRGQLAFAASEWGQAHAAYAEALKLDGHSLEALAGLAEVGVARNDPRPLKRFEKVLASAPKAAGPLMFRRLAQLADQVHDDRLALSSWFFVFSEDATDAVARDRVVVLARSQKDDERLEPVLKAVVSLPTLGAAWRSSGLELVALFERTHRQSEALSLLRELVRRDGTFRRASFALIERLVAHTLHEEAAVEMERALQLVSAGEARQSLLRRLIHHLRERLGADDRAEHYQAQLEAERLGVVEAPMDLPGGPVMVPAPPAGRTAALSAPVLLGATPAASSGPKRAMIPAVLLSDTAASGASRVETRPEKRSAVNTPERLAEAMGAVKETEPTRSDADLVSDDDVDEVDETVGGAAFDDETHIDRPAGAPRPSEGAVDESRQTQEIRVSVRNAESPVQVDASPSAQLRAERAQLFERVRNHPLDSDGYRLLAEHFDTANDASRSSLMLELARAIEGDPNAAPRTPKLMLSAADRLGLRHHLVKNEEGELVALAAPALCRLFPAKGKDAQANEEFRLESGKGARAAADALLAAVRILGIRAPDVFITDEAGPPFSAVQGSPNRLVVTRQAVKKPQLDAELRFYAGRALFTLSAELIALRTLKREHVRAGLESVGQMIRGLGGNEGRVIRDTIAPGSYERLKQLFETTGGDIDLTALMEGARHSVNRAGLVVCGGIAPVLQSLRAKRALPAEMIELVRFAAGERYLRLRNRRLDTQKPSAR
jgi:hypothetical protein